jgi:hypothetical protein
MSAYMSVVAMSTCLVSSIFAGGRATSKLGRVGYWINHSCPLDYRKLEEKDTQFDPHNISEQD